MMRELSNLYRDSRIEGVGMLELFEIAKVSTPAHAFQRHVTFRMR